MGSNNNIDIGVSNRNLEKYDSGESEVAYVKSTKTFWNPKDTETYI